MFNDVQQFNIGGAEVFVAAFDETVEVKPVQPPIRQRVIEQCADLQTKRQRYCVWQLLDYALKKCINKGVDELTFTLDDNGKWSCNGCHFSLSHSGNVVAVAICERAVGVDVEKLDAARFNQRLAERILTANEREVYDTLPFDDRPQALTQIWTAKESLFKRDGGKSFLPQTVDTTAVTTFSESVIFGCDTFIFSVAV